VISGGVSSLQRWGCCSTERDRHIPRDLRQGRRGREQWWSWAGWDSNPRGRALVVTSAARHRGDQPRAPFGHSGHPPMIENSGPDGFEPSRRPRGRLCLVTVRSGTLESTYRRAQS